MKYCVASNLTGSSTTPVPLNGDFCGNLERAKIMGYDAIEIHVPDVRVLDVPRLLETMERTQMAVATLGTGTIYGKYGLHLCDESEENQQRLFEMVAGFVDTAAQLGSRVTIGSIKGNILCGQDRAKHLEILGHALARIDRYAGERNVCILLEATNRYENNVLNTGSDLAAIIRNYNLVHTRALMDAFHMNIEEKDGAQGLEDVRACLGHIHFADNNRLYPGAGCFDFARFAEKIREIGYDGVLSVECLPLPWGDEAARRACEFLHKTFD